MKGFSCGCFHGNFFSLLHRQLLKGPKQVLGILKAKREFIEVTKRKKNSMFLSSFERMHKLSNFDSSLILHFLGCFYFPVFHSTCSWFGNLS